MDGFKVLEVKQSVFASNEREADEVRRALKEKGVFLLNLMSSPGSGKTTTLTRTIELLKDELRIGVMEADIDSDVDARAISPVSYTHLDVYKRQVVSCLAMLCVIPIVGTDAVLVGMPVINGAAMATSLMTTAALEKGLTTAAALCAVIYSVQKFVGAPIASAMGLRYAKKLMVDFRQDPAGHMAALAAKQKGTTSDKKMFYETHKELFTANILIAIVCVGAWVGRVLGDITPINYSIWCLLLGSVSGLGGYIPPRPLQRGSAYGLMMIAVFGSIIPSLAKVSLSDLGTMAFQTVVLFAAAVAGIFIIGYLLPGWKLVGDRDLAVGIGVEQFLGFPSNVVICREVSEAVGQTDDEKTYIEDTLSIPYVLGGITVVTILSVTMAGIVINFL